MKDDHLAPASKRTNRLSLGVRFPRLWQGMCKAGRWLWRHGLGYPLAIIVVAFAALFLYEYTNKPVLLAIDRQPAPYRTHQFTVGGLLREIGLDTRAEDVVIPPAETMLAGGDTVTVLRARPFIVEVNGQELRVYSHARRLGDLLREAGIQFGPHDRILIDGQPADENTALTPANNTTSHDPLAAGSNGTASTRVRITPPPRATPMRIAVRRAVPLYIHDGLLESEIYSAAATVGEALLEGGIILYLGDQVSPSLSTPLIAGLHVYIQRSVPVEIHVDGRRIVTRTRAGTVGELLTHEGIPLFGRDMVTPAEDTPVEEHLTVKVTRVREEVVIEEEAIPFDTVWEPDPELEIDQQRLQQVGNEGIKKRRLRLRYEDGQEVARTLEDEWVERQPEMKVIRYGTKIVLRELETPEGTVQYWRRIRVLATSYTAATSGKDYDHPEYGITFLGWPMRKGIIAVDPTVINLRTEMYVPGYGRGIAGDTGGKIKGRHIDLGYDEDNLVWWYKWVDVYLLAPVPPRSQIRWVLPNWPRETSR